MVMTDNSRPLGGLLRELEGRGMLRTVLGGEGAASVNVTAVDFDSRQSAPGHLFVAVPGAESDGHDYAEAAVGRGAAAVIAEHDPRESEGFRMGKADRPRRLVIAAVIRP